MLTPEVVARRVASVVALASALAACLGAQARSLTPRAVVDAALGGDARIESALLDAGSAEAKAAEAELRKLPSLSLSAGYTRLSDLTSHLSLGPLGDMDISSLDNSYSLNASVQYPIFAGFRLKESAELAALQARGKDVAAEMVKRAVVFEAERAYWEAKRTLLEVGTLRESLDLSTQNLERTRTQLSHGTAMNIDLLTAQMQCDQARMDLDAGVSAERRAFWSLASLVDPGAELAPAPEGQYCLASDAGPVPDGRFPSLEAGELGRIALELRPETRASALAEAAAEVGRKLAEAPLYPTLSISGSYVYADPNSRVYFQSDPWQFTGTWSLSAVVSYDLGGVPANLAERDAQALAARKGVADDRRQRETVLLDVRNTLQAFLQSRRDYALVAGMMDQAKENERVTGEKLAAGTASDLDLLVARLARLKVALAVADKLIDEEIAAADLERAVGLAKL